MARTARIAALMFDGTKHEAIGTYMGLSDRVAFERLFSVSYTDMWRAGLGGKPVPGPEYREERAAWFCWRLLRRCEEDVPDTFDAFVEACEELKIEDLDERLDPTDAEARTESSPKPPTD